MKGIFNVGAKAVLIRPGWRPDAVSVFNPSDRNMYVVEGATDPGVGPNNYTYIARPGGAITMPTRADNFSVVQDAGANVAGMVVLWTRDEVAPSYNAGSEAGAGAGSTAHAVADGVIVVSSAAVVSFAPLIPAGVSPRQLTLGPVENADVRFRITGANPTPTVGEPLFINDVLSLDSAADITALKIIGQTGAAASIYWTLSA